MESSSKARETSVANMSIERQIDGEMTIKEMKTKETTTIITELPASTENKKKGKEATGRLIVGKRRKTNNMKLKTFLWEPHSVDKTQKTTKGKTYENGWKTAASHCTQHTRINI